MSSYLVAAPSENPPPVPVEPRVLEPKLKPDILDLNLQKLTVRTKRERPRGGPEATSYDISWIIKVTITKF